MTPFERRRELLEIQESALKNALQGITDQALYQRLDEDLRKTQDEIALLQSPLKVATVRGYGITGREVEAYMPANYKVLYHDKDEMGEFVVIAGFDVQGWTMDDYIVPRLASGNKYATETAEQLYGTIKRLELVVQGPEVTQVLVDQLAQLEAILSRLSYVQTGERD